MHRLLHLLPPETAHAVSLFMLQHGLAPTSPPSPSSLHISLLGKHFTNPIGLSAGAEKKAQALAGWSRMGFGFVEAGTVTLHPRAGNPKPRLWRLGQGHVVNWLGLPGDGLDAFAQNLADFQNRPERQTLVLGASLASPDGITDEFKTLAATCAPLVDYLTLNASCPNVAHGHPPSALQQVAAQVKAVVGEAGSRPVLLKLGPTRDETSLKATVEAAMEAGASGIVATNTVPHDKKDLLGSALPFAWPQHQGQAVGGYSGPALLDTTCWMVERIRSLLGPDAPIIGVGGIQTGADALRVMRAGANAIQLYTGLIYRGKPLLDEIKDALAQ